MGIRILFNNANIKTGDYAKRHLFSKFWPTSFSHRARFKFAISLIDKYRPKTVIDYANMMNRLLSEGLLTDYMVNYLLRRVRGEKQGAESTTGEGSRYMYFGDTARTNYPPPPRSSL